MEAVHEFELLYIFLFERRYIARDTLVFTEYVFKPQIIRRFAMPIFLRLQ